MPNVAYECRGINHVAQVPEEYITLEAFQAAVHKKYELIDKGGSKGAAIAPAAPVAPAPKTPPKPVPDEAPVGDPPAVGKFRVVEADGVGWFDVLGPDDKAITEKSMRRPLAEKMAAEKNKAL